jgi:hypothetical protein
VSRATTVFDDSGQIMNDSTKEQLQKFIDGFVTFVRTIPRHENS